MGQQVDISARCSTLIVESVSKSYELDELLINMTPLAMSAAFAWGDDPGAELVDV